MTAELEGREAIYPLPAYESWLEDIANFGSKPLERRTELFQAGMKLFSDTIEDGFKKNNRIIFPYLTEGKKIPEEFREAFGGYRRIDIINSSWENNLNATRNFFIDFRTSDLGDSSGVLGDVEMTLSTLDGQSYELRRDFHETDFSSSPGGMTVDKPALIKLSSIQTIKLLNWVAQEVIKETRPRTLTLVTDL